MTTTAEHWRIDILGNSDRMIAAAMVQLNDANEARWFVHQVMLDAMTDMRGPAVQSDLDAALHDRLAEAA